MRTSNVAPTTATSPDFGVLRTYVYYTIIAHANQSGVCAGLSLQDLGDFTGILTNTITQKCLSDLESAGKLRIDQLNRRNRTFYLLDVTAQEQADARAFLVRAQARVAELRAKRAEVQNVAGKAVGVHSEALTIPDVMIEFTNIKTTTKDERRRFRCDVTLTNIGTIRNCYIIEYPNRYGLYGPGRPLDADRTQFRDWVVFHPYLQQIITRAFAERLERNELIFDAAS